MRYAELTFLVLLVAYHAILIIPRLRRPFSANYLIFLAGMALAWNLGIEGLRWQTIPPTILLLIDILVLFPTFATLRGVPLSARFLTFLWKIFRSLVATAGLFVAVGSLLLAVAFPLPQVQLTGGLPPAQRVVRFPATVQTPGLEVLFWYPAGGDTRPRLRAVSDPQTWAQTRSQGGLPVFWQAHQQHLPSNLIQGGKMASQNTRYPVVYVALPPDQSPDDFGYLFEDLASRGFLVAAGRPLPPGTEPAPTFEWTAAWTEVTRPFSQPLLWLEPELTESRSTAKTDYRWMEPTREVLHQLDRQPGDPFYGAVDWDHQALWAWGPGNLSVADYHTLGLKCLIHAGGKPPEGYRSTIPELWITQGKVVPQGPELRILSLSWMNRADLSDSAYLKPYLAFFALKAQPDARWHGALRQYQAAFLQFGFWGTGADTSFRQTVPVIEGLTLTGN